MPTTVSFAYTGAAQTWAVPADAVSPITVTLSGAGGGDGGVGGASPPAGGAGGLVVGTLAVVPGTDVLTINVGQAGAVASTATGFGGGGPGGSGVGGVGCRAGGASDIRLNGTGLANRVAVAGAGGGAGRTSSGATVFGGDGGTATGAVGRAGTGGTLTAPTGGTASAGGAAGVGNTGNGSAGASGVGGSGGSNATAGSFGGGGGGGGYFGGGGGGAKTAGDASSSGAGGSSYTGGLASVTTNTQGTGSAAQVNGVVSITYDQVPGAPAVYPPGSAALLDANDTEAVYVEMPSCVRWLVNDPDSGDVMTTSNVQYGPVGGSLTTVVVPATSLTNVIGAYVFPANTFTPGQYQVAVQTTDSSGAQGPYSTPVVFTMLAQPAAAFPFVALGDQWPDSTTVETDEPAMVARIDGPLVALGTLLSAATRTYLPDPTRQCDVGGDFGLLAGVTVTGGQPIVWDSVTDTPSGSLSTSGQALNSLVLDDPQSRGLILIPIGGQYLLAWSVAASGTPGAGLNVALTGLPTGYGKPTRIMRPVLHAQCGMDPMPVQFAGGEQLSLVPDTTIALAGSGGISSTTGYLCHLTLWRIGL